MQARFRLRPLVAALMALSTAALALDPAALPQNGSVTGGAGSISVAGANMRIDQASQRLALQWDSFNIGQAASVTFVQPSSSALALNRVLSADPSQIFGRLSANGQVFLVNPGGVIFGAGAQVNVGGLVASTLSLGSADFMAGNYQFGGEGTGSVLNYGSISAPGGSVVLLGHQVANHGNISAPRGSVTLAAGAGALLDLHGDGLISVQVDAAAAGARVLNAGVISADGGSVLLTARARDALLDTVVNNSGLIEARGLVSRNGMIVLEAPDAGVVAVSGTLDASGKTAGLGGGTVKVLGDKVALYDGARIDVSGDAGGGSALVGGDWQGTAGTRRASATFVAEGAAINADAISSGNGGKVVVWSDDSTRYYGNIRARGGAAGGNGGMVETSGHYLEADGTVNASARAAGGAAGNWLLDPYDITIGAGATAGGAYGGGSPNVFTPSANASVANVTTLTTSLNAGTSVTVATGDTGSPGGQSGNITVSAAISKTAGGDATLTLRAARDINVNANIGSTSNKLNVVLNSARQTSGVGSVSLGSGAQIVSNGGNITIGGGADPATGYAFGGGVTNSGFRMVGGGALIDAGAGNISINARGTSTSQAFTMGTSANTIQTTSGNISINALNAGASAMGLNSGTNTIRATGSGNVSINAQSTDTGASLGLTMGSGGTSTIQVNSGTLNITGASAGSSSAVSLGSGTNTINAVGTGSVNITGTASGSGGGVVLGAGGTNLIGVAGGNLNITGIAQGSGIGISTTSTGSSSISAAGGNINLSGVSATGNGIALTPGAGGSSRVEATGSGNLTAYAQSGGTGQAFTMTNAGTSNAVRSANGSISITALNTNRTGFGMGSGTNLIESTGAGNVNISGTSTGTTAGFGVTIGGGGTNTVRVANGNMTVTGASAGSDSGVSQGSGTNTLEATGTGSITVSGSNSGAGNGTAIGTGGTNRMQVTSGTLSVSGKASGSGDGLRISGAGNSSLLSGSGNILLTGSSAGDTGISMVPTAGLTQVRSSGAGNITFTADTMDLVPAGGTVQVQGNGGILSIAPVTPGTTIGIGDGASGTLNWNATEVAQVLPGFAKIRIGNALSGSIDMRPPASLFSAPVELVGPRASIYPAGLLDQINAALGAGNAGEAPPGEDEEKENTGQLSIDIAKELK